MSTTKRKISPLKYHNEAATMKKQKLTNSFEESNHEDASTNDNFDFLFDDIDDFDLLATAETKAPTLDLSSWTRCVVVEVEREQRSYDFILTVRGEYVSDKENDGAFGKCHLQGPWSQTHIDIGDIVSLQAVWDTSLNVYKVNKDHGFCVTNPDALISGTTVVGSLFCRRKAVLQDRFRGVDASNKVMVIGSLVHELLQIVLGRALKTYEEIDAAAQELIRSQETAFTLYGSLMTRTEIAGEIERFVPNILSFVEQYVEGQESQVLQKDSFEGQIAQIADIEENVWVPQLGLKGKIDVSVHTRRRRCGQHYGAVAAASANAIPLELKTGRATFSMEHKGQLILYQMMLTAIGRETHSGLLLYLRDGIMREIRGSRNEQRDLIVLRNELAHYLSAQTQIPTASDSTTAGPDKIMQPFQLPEPISHHSACSNCAYATICCAFAKMDTHLELHNAHPLHKLMQTVTVHIQPEDYVYFMSWCSWLALEEEEMKKSNYLRTLWTDKPAIRQQHGRAIIDLELQGNVELKDSRYLHIFSFTSTAREDADFTLSGFSMGEYVIVSTNKRLAIAAGCIYELDKASISISLERNLHKNYTNETFIVDKHESMSSHVFNFTNLGLLLEDNARAAALRSIVVQRQQPTFHKKCPKDIATKGAEILSQLNAVQRSAVLKALTTDSFMLIKGLPGTGKTQTLVSIVRLLNLLKKSVLITSHTHSAVDNLMLRLKPHGLAMLRLGAGARIHPQLLEYSESEIMGECRSETALAEKYAAYNIVGVTCLGAAHSIFLHRKFDFCIVDEATQVMQPTVLRPLYFCEKFILVGDPDQLPPLIRSREARQRGADESLFHRLDSTQATSVLTLQYRMNKTITKLANELTYAGALQCASPEVQMAALNLKLPTAASIPIEKWLQRALQTHIDQATFLLDTLDCAERSFAFANAKHRSTCVAIEQSFAESPTKQQSTRKRLSKYTNYCDAAVIFYIVKALLEAGYDATRIGIIAPYRAQVELLRKLAAQHQSYYETKVPTLKFALVEVNTVDQYQGRDKDIVLYSCTKTGGLTATAHDVERAREAELLEDKRRLTVAITRAKLKLILIGDAACMQQYTPFRTLLAHIPSQCKLQLVDGKQGFEWKTLLAELAQIIAI